MARDYFLSTLASFGLHPRVAHRAASFEMLRGLVAGGFGYTLLNFCPPFIVDGRNHLVARGFEAPIPDQHLVLGRLYATPLISSFANLLTIVESACRELTTSS